MNPTTQKRKILQWSPHSPSHFVIGANDLRLYEINFKNTPNSSSPLNFTITKPSDTNETESPDEASSDRDKNSINLISVNSEVQQLKCLAWCPDGSVDKNLIAVGLPSGKVVLTSYSSVNRIYKEFIPRHSRSCNVVAWNPVYQNQLAAGLDKVRSDFSTIVWDVNQSTFPKGYPAKPPVNKTKGSSVDAPHTIIQSYDSNFNILPTEATESITTPLAELANSESTVSLAWLPGMPSCLASGTGVKWLRIYDLRKDIKAPKSVVAHSKGVLGIHFDPFNDERLCTFSEDSVVKLWDLRKLTDAVLSLHVGSKPVMQVAWSPNRSGLLATLSKDDNVVKFWDIRDNVIRIMSGLSDFDSSQRPSSASSSSISLQTATSAQAQSATVINTSASVAIQPAASSSSLTPGATPASATICLLKPTRSHQSPENLACISFWNGGGNDDKMLNVTNSGALEVVSLQESIPISISSNSDLSFGFGKFIVEAIASELKNDENEVDVSDLIKARAKEGYSLEIESNMKIVSNYPENLRFLWSWMHHTQNTRADFSLGVHYVICSGSNNSDSEAPDSSIEGKGFPRVFTSNARKLAQTLCGWDFYSSPSAFEATLMRLEQQSQLERAVALAVFHFDVKRAVVALQRAASRVGPNLKLVAMVLAGYNDSVGLWKETCRELKNQFQDPYLNAAFRFLCRDNKTTSANDFFQDVLELGMSLWDKIGFATRFLSDSKLTFFIEKVTQQAVQNGDLEGIVLTGLTAAGVDLLQRYLDKTGDVQTVALVANYVPMKHKDGRVSKWMETYRSLLDRWQLWHERSMFDIERSDAEPKHPQVFARCNFCNQSISLPMIHPTKSIDPSLRAKSTSSSSAAAAQQRISSCPSCKKPLPRCAICLLPMNCTVPSFQKASGGGAGANPASVGSSGSGIGGGSGLASGEGSKFEQWFTWCQTCRHGGHAGHILEWFERHIECPVSDCKCCCMSL